MKPDILVRLTAVLTMALLIDGCARQPIKAPARPTTPQPAPVPPAGAGLNISLPDTDGNGVFKTINYAISPDEAVWHVRSALNVAALACNDRAVVADYNALLKRQTAPLAAAYEAEAKSFRSSRGESWRGAMDAHMTRLYNYFAQPAAQKRFCAAAARTATEIQSVTPGDLRRYASTEIVRLDSPFQDFYREHAAYRRGLNKDGGAVRAASTLGSRTATAASWRVQLGAFSGWDAARSAWQVIRGRAPGLASFEPHFEEAPAKRLVRLQVGPASSREEALRLCAAAAAGGLDCLPVSPSH